MKKAFLYIFFFSLSTTLWAQEAVTRSYNASTLLKDGGRPTGGFIGLQPKLTYLADQVSFLTGGQMAVVLAHQFNIGVAGYALLSDVTANYGSTNGQLPVYMMPIGKVEFAYVGLLLEPVFFSKNAVHFTVPVVIGPGIGSVRSKRIWEANSYNIATDVFGVVEPGLNLELNLTRMVRFNVGASYRFVFDSDLPGVSDKTLSDIAIMAGFKFGWF
jgi:hypothetical protein